MSKTVLARIGDCVLLLLGTVVHTGADTRLWSEWWSYKGISGPEFWGVLNQDWSLCTKGQHQSPVDINPKNLVYDPNLRPMRIDAHRVDGYVINTGHDITFYVDASYPRPFAFTGGPLSYTYRVHHLKIHFGSLDVIGSEHTVGGKPFPLELQIYGFNTELFPSFQDALLAAHGVAAIALFGNLGDGLNKDFDFLVKATNKTPYKDYSTPMLNFSMTALLSETHDYVTYEGSMTQPSCLETITWIIFNRPIHIQKSQLALLRRLHEAAEVDSPPLLMENNFRPPMPVNRRTIRTNIKPQYQDTSCGTQKIAFYEGAYIMSGALALPWILSGYGQLNTAFTVNNRYLN